MSEHGGQGEPLESGMGGADTGGSPGSVGPAGLTEAQAREALEQVGTAEQPGEQAGEQARA